MPPAFPRVLPRVLLPSLVLALLASGCGTDDDPTADAPTPTSGPSQRTRPPAPQPRDTPHAHPTRSPSSRPSTPGKTAPVLPLPGRSATLAHLLDEDLMPALTDGSSWVVEQQGPEGDDPVGACQKTPLVSIGAVSASRRDFATQDGAGHASQVVGRFADSKSAWQAHEVLRAWREDCEQRLAFPRKDVGPLEDVRVETGIGASYAASYGPKPEAKGLSAGFGLVRKGRFLSIVEITAPSVEWPHRWDPARAAVRRIARTFA